jgi:hypothetical protein
MRLASRIFRKHKPQAESPQTAPPLINEETGGMPSATFVAHTCSYCQEIEICLPSQSDLYRASRFAGNQSVHRGFTIEGSHVLEGSRHSCELFRWALDGFQKQCTNEHVEDWKLTAGIPFRDIASDSPDFKVILFFWALWSNEGHPDRWETLDLLSVIAVEGNDYQSKLPKCANVKYI